MRTTITLDDDVYRSARTLAQGSGKSLGAVVSELARRGLQPRRAHKSRDGLPVFDVPPNAAVIPGDLAAELLDEQGLD